MSTTTENATRPPRAPAASVVLTTLAIVLGLVLAPVGSAAAAEPLPTGTYEVVVAAGTATVTVQPDGGVGIAASDGLVVVLSFDEQQRALDEFTVLAGDRTYLVEIDVEDDGSYTTTVEEEGVGDEGATATGAVVSTVAGCAPTGLVAAATGWPNHGSIVSLAASGLPLEATVSDPVSGTEHVVTADFSSLEGAEAFCELVAATVPTLAEVRAHLAAEREAAREDRESARTDLASAREAAKRANESAREAARLEREAERLEQAAERDAALRDAAEERAARQAERAARERGRPAATDTDGGTETATTTDGEPPSTDTTDGAADDTTDGGDTEAPADESGPGNGNGNGKGSGKPVDVGKGAGK